MPPAEEQGHLDRWVGNSDTSKRVTKDMSTKSIEIPTRDVNTQPNDVNTPQHPANGVTASTPTPQQAQGSDFATTIANATHTWLLDEPTSVPGAKDLGPNPFHMVLAGLAGCTHMTMGMYARRKGYNIGNTEVHVDVTSEGDTTTFHRDITFDPALDAQQRAKLLEIANKCPVHRLLERDIHIETRETP